MKKSRTNRKLTLSWFENQTVSLEKQPDGSYNLCINISKDVLITILKQKFKEKQNIISLSARQKEVLRKIIKGKNNTEIAKELFISVHTVKAHVSNILNLLSVQDRVQAAVKAISENLLD